MAFADDGVQIESPQVWYPACWVRLQIRVEDFVRKNPDDPTIVDPPTPSDPVVKGGFVSLGYNVVPQTCSVSLRSFREGDEARISIPAGRLPIDPRVIRQMSVNIYMGCLDGNVYQEAMGQGTVPDGGPVLLPFVDPDTGNSNEIFRGFVDDLTIIHGEDEDELQITCRDITGFLLDAELPLEALNRVPRTATLDQVIKLLVDGEPGALLPQIDQQDDRPKRVFNRFGTRLARNQVASLTGRIARLTVSIAAEPANTRLVSELNRLNVRLADAQARLAEATAAEDLTPILAARLGLPGARGIVVVNETGGPLPPVGDIKGAAWFDSLGQAKSGREAGGKQGRISYWDFITDMCVGSGYICYFRIPRPILLPTGVGVVNVAPPAELVISEPRTYYYEAGGQTRRFAYGYNVDRLSVSRNYNGKQMPTSVIISAIEDGSGKIVTGRYPPLVLNKTKRSTTAVTATGDRDEAVRYLVNSRLPAGTATVLLERYAQSVYQQLARGEMEVNIETDVLRGYPFGDAKPDMLWLRPADPIEVEISPEDLQSNQSVTQVGAYQRLSTDQRIQRLVEMGMDTALAVSLAQAEDSPLIQKVFRVQDMSVDFDSETGFNFTVRAINFLTIDSAATLAQTPTDS